MTGTVSKPSMKGEAKKSDGTKNTDDSQMPQARTTPMTDIMGLMA